MAGMVSLVNSARRERGKSTLGWLNPALYALYPAFVHDITHGENRCLAAGAPCCEQGFVAAQGWDPVTGLGSIDFEKFKQTMMDIGEEPTDEKAATAPALHTATATAGTANLVRVINTVSLLHEFESEARYTVTC